MTPTTAERDRPRQPVNIITCIVCGAVSAFTKADPHIWDNWAVTKDGPKCPQCAGTERKEGAGCKPAHTEECDADN